MIPPIKPDNFFPPQPDSRPAIYAYEDTHPQYAGLLKVGYTTVDVQARVAQQCPTLRPGKPPYRIVLEESAPAMKSHKKGSTFPAGLWYYHHTETIPGTADIRHGRRGALKGHNMKKEIMYLYGNGIIGGCHGFPDIEIRALTEQSKFYYYTKLIQFKIIGLALCFFIGFFLFKILNCLPGR